MRERSIQVRVRALISEECENYQGGSNGVANYCWMRETSNHGACVFFSDLENPKCRYFEEAVLPLDEELKGIFSNEALALGIRTGQKKALRKKCGQCPEIFLAKSNAQRLCPECQKRNSSLKNPQNTGVNGFILLSPFVAALAP